jgi:hypothetical protein
MLGSQLDASQAQMALVLPRPRGGVAPSRREVALADYLERQRIRRQPRVLGLRHVRAAAALWNLILRVCRVRPGRGAMVRHPGPSVADSAYGH